MTFQQKLNKLIQQNNSLLCIGLDSDFEKLPEHLKQNEHPQFTFNKAIIDTTHDLVSSYKINSAFYEARGAEGIQELKQTCDYINNKNIPIILDAKRADIGNTNNGYISFAFDYLGVDAITLHPYLGREALKPFLEKKDKGCIILCRTSNSGAGELQDLKLVIPSDEGVEGPVCRQARSHTTKPLYEIVANKVANEWNQNNNCLLVVGATYPEEMKKIREITKDMTFLVPGIGAQGGNVEQTIKAGLNAQNAGLIIHSARGIIFASSKMDFAKKAREEAKKLKNEINKYRK